MKDFFFQVFCKGLGGELFRILFSTITVRYQDPFRMTKEKGEGKQGLKTGRNSAVRRVSSAVRSVVRRVSGSALCTIEPPISRLACCYKQVQALLPFHYRKYPKPFQNDKKAG
ncbi:hypothetical protein ACD591_04840 [Rufibacter glacialis]|uniref:Uncharacterized protein n=1 Tax=Rufibacter glacialis TaxID=1259555 RepID=A0A5M8QIA3_9BACT|nr:hypothetical protein [Rufibacter glacialis]KAA6434680.1 hypothetical protein FOE74_10900 [Rufibacter glacialis]